MAQKMDYRITSRAAACKPMVIHSAGNALMQADKTMVRPNMAKKAETMLFGMG
jgi:hypothetical protein